MLKCQRLMCCVRSVFVCSPTLRSHSVLRHYVRFHDLDGARAALAMSGIVINGTDISIEQAADAERDMKRDDDDAAKMPVNVSFSRTLVPNRAWNAALSRMLVDA